MTDREMLESLLCSIRALRAKRYTDGECDAVALTEFFDEADRIIDTSGACPHLRLITEHENDPTFYPRTGCLDCDTWFGPVVCR